MSSLTSSINLHNQSPALKPIQFRSANQLGSHTANIKWTSTSDTVNFMEHLYFITSLVLDYLIEKDLPQELLNSTSSVSDPLQVLYDHRNELIRHFHMPLLIACSCLCIGISIPLFGIMIVCCWYGDNGKAKPLAKSARSSRHRGRHSRSHGRHRQHHSRHHSVGSSHQLSRHHHGRHPDYQNEIISDSGDWVALPPRDPNYLDKRERSRARQTNNLAIESSRLGRGGHVDHRIRRHGRNYHRSSNIAGVNHESESFRSHSLPPLRYESTCHPCLRTFLSSNLFVLLLLISFFVICAFVTNEYIHSSTDQFPRAVNQSLGELQSYLNNTSNDFENLFRYNYNQLENEINRRLDSSGVIIKQKLASTSEAAALNNLIDIVTEFNDTRLRLDRINRELSTLKSRIHTARIALIDLRDKVEQCPVDKCPMLRRKYPLENFRILPQYEKLPDVKQAIKKVTYLIESGIVMQVKFGSENFDSYATQLQNDINQAIPNTKKQLSIIGKRLSSVGHNISESFKWSDRFFEQLRSATGKLDQYNEYEKYRRYVCLTGASLILFILLCYSLGWLHGTLRPQPTSRTFKTRVKTSASASFPFSCGIFTVFLLLLPLILLATVLFITGTISDRLICQVIKHPEQNQSRQVYALMQNQFLNSNLSMDSNIESDESSTEYHDGREYKIYKPNYADLISRCHKNLSIYKVLKLERYDSIEFFHKDVERRISLGLDQGRDLNIVRYFNLDNELRNHIKSLEVDMSQIILLTKPAEQILSESSDMSLDEIESSFARLYESGTSIPALDMDQLIRDLNVQKASVSELQLESKLTLTLIHASSLNEQILPNITSSLSGLKEAIRHLKFRMFRGKNSYGTVISDLIAKVRSAESQLRTNGNALVKISANDFVDELNGLIDQYGAHLRNQVESVIGQCEPVSRAINRTTSAFCDDIILPLNGYWLSALSSLILILPSTLIAYALKTLYSLAQPSIPVHHNYSYEEQNGDVSWDDDADIDSSPAYHLQSHFPAHKPSSSRAAPTAPASADEGGWSPTSSGYNPKPRPPPPYAV